MNMEKWTANKIRKTWLDYFVSNGHYLFPSQSLIPHNDPSLLWINSGVATLKPYFSGTATPPSNRLTSSQRSIRTNDIFNIGVTSRHHTFFEMLGNFSIGDYFKKEAIHFAYDLLVNHYHLDVNRLYFTVFEEDDDAYQAWLNHGINPKKITKCNRDRNFWDVGSGPCGPCTEIYYDRGEKFDPNNIGEKLFFEDIENDRYVEIWNVVFSQFNNNGKNEYTELARKNIDTGAGLERLASVLQSTPTNYDTDLFLPIIKTIEKYSKSFKYDVDAYFTQDKVQKNINRNFIIIADHIKACVFAIADGAVPSAKERGAVLRKLIRRSIICAKFLELSNDFLTPTIHSIIETMSEFYPYLIKNEKIINEVILQEQKLFSQTFNKGYELYIKALNNSNELDAETVFKLSDTYGFPFEVIKNLCEQNNIKFDQHKYDEIVLKHQQISHGNKKIKAMVQQNENLMNFKLNSLFIYDILQLKDSKIIALFDQNYEPLISINNGNCWIVFDKTCFYATSGGQEHDLGLIKINNQELSVANVIKAPNGQYLHLINTQNKITVGDTADLFVDELNRKLTSCNHSCEHLLQKALQTVVSDSIHQEGASKNAQKFTFDFSYQSKLTKDQLIEVENKVNEYIGSKQKVETKMMTLDDAKKIHAQAHFEKIYAKINGLLRVVIMDGITSEVCGGTHPKNLGEIEQFMIAKYETKGSGSYRIEGITTNNTIKRFIESNIQTIKNSIQKTVNELKRLKVNESEYKGLIQKLDFSVTRQNYHSLVDQYQDVKTHLDEIIKVASLNRNANQSKELKHCFDIDKDNTVLTAEVNDIEPKVLSNALNQLANEHTDKAFIAFNITNDKVRYFVISGKKVVDQDYKANSLIKKINETLKGSGGGSPEFGQGGCDLDNYKNNIKKLIF